MAIIKNKTIIGAIGEATFTTYRGKPVMRKRVRKGGIKQTVATKNAARVFGLASRFGSDLREQLNAIYYIQDGTMVNRLNKEMTVILRRHLDKSTGDYHFPAHAFKPLEGFEFNALSPLKEQLDFLPETTLQEANLLIRMPEFDVKKGLKFPEEANSCTIMLTTYVASLKTKHRLRMTYDCVKSFTIDKDDLLSKPQEWMVEVPEGCFCVTAMALHYHKCRPNLQISLNSKSFSPAMICDFSINPGEFKETSKKWIFNSFAFVDGAHPPIKKEEREKNITEGKKADDAESLRNAALQQKLDELTDRLSSLETLLRQHVALQTPAAELTPPALPKLKDFSAISAEGPAPWKAALKNVLAEQPAVPFQNKQVKVRGKPAA